MPEPGPQRPKLGLLGSGGGPTSAPPQTRASWARSSDCMGVATASAMPGMGVRTLTSWPQRVVTRGRQDVARRTHEGDRRPERGLGERLLEPRGAELLERIARLLGERA